MKPTVVFVRVPAKPEYLHGEQRWLESYLRFKPEIDHGVVIINNHGDGDPDFLPGATNLRYDGGGWDCGAWRFAAKTVKSPILACFNSSTRITGQGWLERFVGAIERHGEGLYGPLTSFENTPHIRTPCLVFPPEVMNRYPKEVESREDTYRFESLTYPDGTPNVTQWAKRQGLQTNLVTWDGVYPMAEWRKPPNIFRRGDQSNLIVVDRHCDAYAVSDAAGKAYLEKLADSHGNLNA